MHVSDTLDRLDTTNTLSQMVIQLFLLEQENEEAHPVLREEHQSDRGAVDQQRGGGKPIDDAQPITGNNIVKINDDSAWFTHHPWVSE